LSKNDFEENSIYHTKKKNYLTQVSISLEEMTPKAEATMGKKTLFPWFKFFT